MALPVTHSLLQKKLLFIYYELVWGIHRWQEMLKIFDKDIWASSMAGTVLDMENIVVNKLNHRLHVLMEVKFTGVESQQINKHVKYTKGKRLENNSV